MSVGMLHEAVLRLTWVEDRNRILGEVQTKVDEFLACLIRNEVLADVVKVEANPEGYVLGKTTPALVRYEVEVNLRRPEPDEPLPLDP